MARSGINAAELVFIVLVTLLLHSASTATAAPCFSQLQVLGSHNSFHDVPPKPIIDLLTSPLAKAVVPPVAFLPQAWEYQHPELSSQLEAGIRSFEFDIHPDPDGGLYSSPAMLKFAGVSAKLPDPALQQPGYKVLHVPDIDFATTCSTLVACLTAVKEWSDANPSHVPITIILQTSFGETDLVSLLGDTGKLFVESSLAASVVEGPTKLTVQPAASKELLGSIESEILSVFSPDKIIAPDSVRTALNVSPTADLTKILLQASTETSCPWPDLETLRGKVIFGLIFPDQGTADLYKDLHPGQKGAVSWMVWDSFYIPEAIMYTAGGGLNLSLEGGEEPPNLPKNASAIVKKLSSEISERSKAGYLVRARADADTIEARLGYVGRASAVLNSAANIVSTDYGMPTRVLPGINYSVKLYGDQPARCVNGAALGTYTGAEVSCELVTTPNAAPLGASGGASVVIADDSTSKDDSKGDNGNTDDSVSNEDRIVEDDAANSSPSPMIEKASPIGGSESGFSESSGGSASSSANESSSPSGDTAPPPPPPTSSPPSSSAGAVAGVSKRIWLVASAIALLLILI